MTKSKTPTRCDQCPLISRQCMRAFEPAEFEFVRRFKAGEFSVQPGTSVVLQGTTSPHLFTVLDGWMVRYTMLEDGRRQILNFALPGDFIGLQTSIFNEMDHSVEALTDGTLCVFPRDNVWNLFKNHPGLAYDLTWLATREERMISDILVSVGQRSAFERIGYIFLHLHHRCKVLELGRGNAFPAPFTQQHLADLLGLSLVHTNKTLRKLIDRGLVEWDSRKIVLNDIDELQRIALYTPPAMDVRPFI